MVQRWLVDEECGDARLVVVTERGVGVVPGEVVDAGAAAVWGLVRSAQAENPGRITIVDADADAVLTAHTLPSLLATDEPQLALRGAELHAPRLTRTAPENSEPVSLDPDGTVLVTGGTGDLGALVARHLVHRYGARHLVLVSRSGARAAGTAELQAELAAAGAQAEVVSCDVADRAAVAQLLSAVPAEHPLTGVVHCAGALDDGVIGALDEQRIGRVFAPKYDALCHLDELTRESDLELFVLFSSAAGVLGTPGQGNYAAANAAADAVVRARRAAGLPGVSMAWGWWGQGSGLTGKLSEADRERFARGGVVAMSPDEGLALFDAALAHGDPELVPVKLDVTKLGHVGTLSPLLSGLVAGPAGTARRTAHSGDGRNNTEALRAKLAALPGPEQERLLLDLVVSQVATVLGHSRAAGVEASKPFTALGFDSLTAVELRNRLSQETGLRLPATLTFDHPTPLALTQFLQTEISPSETQTLDWAMNEIDKMESVLSELPPDDAVRARVTDRLRVLLSRAGEPTSEVSGAVLTEQLQASSSEELFQFVDRQLGA
ncbi:acyl carrier protein [Streptomyces zagrosensis]|uniref:Acyl carrier protein n=1 Tax=Streptomyces zagrosensis TaxID=1042984 RepID=A0A7W9V2M3_9ACTN|nr:type I polyketide synthase [Streptomyces zagrosensis]MBB5940440.1 acyl carrier protein [Streptomyces zagrosensis]